ncbi:Nitrate/nitrite transporter NarK [Pseudonocardia ammonioxydans]|uniref:Nitrate/nitrite transporter NarK n=1 Tax=Pseudonocardia ammonioxydans TaxID=260086 RepID=A0A1I5G8H4_PSUAM|nr:MFS transporter [Pseudonocardia ammonioxydans]SFO32355.1 Nitrate/nitrite transporter NarK [Pseudonocardia ammonioxydans]
MSSATDSRASEAAAPSAFRVAAGAVAVTTVSVLPVFLTGALAVQLSADLGFDPAGLGLVVALYFGVSALCSLPVGMIVERVGSRWTSRIAALGAAALMTALALFATSYASLVALLLCSAWCNVMGQLSSNLTLARSVPARRMGLSFGVKQAAIPTATLLAGVAVPAIALTVGWRWAYVIGAVLALSALFLCPRENAGPPARPRKADRATAALGVIGAASGLAAGTATALGVFLVSSAVERGVAPGLAGLVLTMGSVIGLSVRLLHGWLADRREEARASSGRGGGHVAVVAGSLAAGAAGFGLLAVPGTPALVIGTVLAFGLGWAWPGLLQFAVVRLNPSAPAAATSIVQVGVYAGGFAGPIVFGWLATHAGFPVAWSVNAVVMLVSAALMLVGRRMLLAHARR